jgi:hypothetical protein
LRDGEGPGEDEHVLILISNAGSTRFALRHLCGSRGDGGLSNPQEPRESRKKSKKDAHKPQAAEGARIRGVSLHVGPDWPETRDGAVEYLLSKFHAEAVREVRGGSFVETGCCGM